MRKALMIAFGLLVLFGAGVFFYMRLSQDGRPRRLPFTSMRLGANAIIVDDQRPSSEISVALVTLIDPAFAAIHEDEQGPGRVYAYSPLLPPGATERLVLKAAGRLTAGYYYAVLHADDGDGAFEPGADPFLKDEKGNIVMTRFLLSDEDSR